MNGLLGRTWFREYVQDACTAAGVKRRGVADHVVLQACVVVLQHVYLKPGLPKHR